MFRPFIYITTLLLILSSCGSSKKATISEEQNPIPPAGIEFKSFSNYKEIASYNLPIEGKGFKSKYINDNSVPSIKYNAIQFQVVSSINDFEGTLEEQFEKAKKVFRMKIQENTKITFNKKIVGAYNTAQFELYRDIGHGYKTMYYGYLIEHNNKATLIFLKEGYLTPETNVFAYRTELDNAIQYMIKTLKYK